MKPLLIAAVLACTSCSTALRTGDLLFHVVAADNQITLVTPASIDHVAIYAGRGQVVEAIPHEGVVVTPLRQVLRRDDGHYLRGRVTSAARRQSVSNARQYLGQPYDTLFLTNNATIYCSELVLLSFVDKQGNAIFSPVPMTFRDAHDSIPRYWQHLYARHRMAVPEGEPGSNPGELSQRRQVKLSLKPLH